MALTNKVHKINKSTTKYTNILMHHEKSHGNEFIYIVSSQSLERNDCEKCIQPLLLSAGGLCIPNEMEMEEKKLDTSRYV